MRKIRKPPMQWLSFCDSDRPEGEQFLGVIILRARDVVEGARRAHRLGINPGGQVACWQIPRDEEPPEEFTNRLLTKEDIVRMQGEAHTVGEVAERYPDSDIAKQLQNGAICAGCHDDRAHESSGSTDAPPVGGKS